MLKTDESQAEKVDEGSYRITTSSEVVVSVDEIKSEIVSIDSQIEALQQMRTSHVDRLKLAASKDVSDATAALEDLGEK